MLTKYCILNLLIWNILREDKVVFVAKLTINFKIKTERKTTVRAKHIKRP